MPAGADVNGFTMRDAIVAIVCLVGGAGAGGGATILQGGGVRDEVSRLIVKVDDLATAVSMMTAEGRSSEREHSGFRRVDEDHELRIRKLEEKAHK